MRVRGRRRPKLGKLRRKGDLEGLREAATFKDVLVARDGRLIDKGVPIRVAALEALSKPEGEEVLPALAAGLSDESPDVRRAAVAGLAADGSADAIGELVDFLASPVAGEDPASWRSAVDHVCGSEWPGFTERWAQRVRETRSGPLGDADRQTFTALLAADNRAEPQQRVFAALAPALASDGVDAGTVDACRSVLEWCTPTRFDGLAPLLSKDPVSGSLIRLAGMTGDQALLDPLTMLLDRPDDEVRRATATALGALCDTRAVLPLLKATSDPELSVRQSALAAFDSLGGAGVTAAMSLLLQANRGADLEQGAAQEVLDADDVEPPEAEQAEAGEVADATPEEAGPAPAEEARARPGDPPGGHGATPPSWPEYNGAGGLLRRWVRRAR